MFFVYGQFQKLVDFRIFRLTEYVNCMLWSSFNFMNILKTKYHLRNAFNNTLSGKVDKIIILRSENCKTHIACKGLKMG